MVIVEQVTLINAPADLVYRISQDNVVRYEWDPAPEPLSLVAPDALAGGADLPGAGGAAVQRRARFGIALTLEYVQLAPPVSAQITMIAGPHLLESYAGCWIFEERSPSHTFATFRYTLGAKRSLLRWPIEQMAALYLSVTAKHRLAALKDYSQKRYLMGKGKVLPKRKKLIPKF